MRPTDDNGMEDAEGPQAQPPRDVSDELFGDDALRASIEAADRSGAWRDPDARFRDPKLEALAEQLSRPAAVDYAERRRRELAGEKPPPRTRPAPSATVAPERLAPLAAIVPTPVAAQAQAAPAPPVTAPAAAASTLGWWPSLLAAALVIAPAALLQGALGGWHWPLLWRSLAAAALLGIGWEFAGAGRFRALCVAGLVYLPMFVRGGGSALDGAVLGQLLGLLVVMLLAGFAGILRENRAFGGRH